MRLRLPPTLLLAILGACSRAPEPPAGAIAPSEPANLKAVVFLGDSLTAGYGVAAQDAYPALLDAAWREMGAPYAARNAGVSGGTSAGTLENLDWNLQPDVAAVFLAIGANDGLRGQDLSQTEKNLDKIVRKVKAAGAKPALAGMRLPPNYGAEYSGRFAAMYPRVAKRHGIPLMPFLLDGVAGLPEFNLADGIHPNERGHALMAKNVGEFLRKEGLVP